MSDHGSAASSRRRWLSIAELVALIGVVVAGLGVWNSWQERRETRSAQAAVAVAGSREQSRVDLTGVPRADGRELLLKDPRHDIQDVTIAFPSALGITAQRPLADAVILAEPLRDALLDGNDHHAGRLPVLVTTRVVDGDAARTATAIYDLVWTTAKPLLRGRALRLDTLRLHSRGGSQAALDALWGREKAARAR